MGFLKRQPESVFFLTTGALFQLSSLWGIGGATPFFPLFIGLFAIGYLLWLRGTLAQTGGFPRVVLGGLPLLVPFLVPAFFLAGLGVYFLSHRSPDLFLQSDFVEFYSHLVLPGTVLSPEERIAEIRALQPAGDILQGDDLALKQSVLALIGEEVSGDVVRLLQGAKNDPEDEIRLIAATLLTRIEHAFREKIERLKVQVESVERERLLGEAYFAYADSGLLVGALRLREVRSGLECFLKVFKQGESLADTLLVRASREAIMTGDKAFLEEVRRVVALSGRVEINEQILLTELFERKDYVSFFRLAASSTNESTHHWYRQLSEWEGRMDSLAGA